MTGIPYNIPLITYITILISLPIFPTDKLLFFILNKKPIISVPPVEPLAVSVIPSPIPPRIPPIKTLVKISSTKAALGIGITDKNIV